MTLDKFFKVSASNIEDVANQLPLIKNINSSPTPVEIKKGVVVDKNAKKVTVLSKNEKVYAQGEGLLKIAPFDNYYLFTIYSEENLENVPVDIHNMGYFFLTFKDKESEVKIENYRKTKEADLVNGQILFRISQEEAEKILTLDTDVFYITCALYNGNSKSDETVVYSGKFMEYNDASNVVLSDKIALLNSELEILKNEKSLKEKLLNSQIIALNDRITNLSNEYRLLDNTMKKYKDAYLKLCKRYGIQSTINEETTNITNRTTQQVSEIIASNSRNVESINSASVAAAASMLEETLPGISLSPKNYDNSVSAYNSTTTVESSTEALSNVNVKTGIVTVYAFMYTKRGDLDTEVQITEYEQLSNLFEYIKSLVNKNPYNNITCSVVYRERDNNNDMPKYNVTSDCIVITKNNSVVLGKISVDSTSNSNLIVQQIANIIRQNNN